MALRSLFGAEAPIAKPKSRKKPAPRCAAFPWSRRAGVASVFTARGPPLRARSSPGPTRPVSFREHVRRQFLDTRSRKETGLVGPGEERARSGGLVAVNT